MFYSPNSTDTIVAGSRAPLRIDLAHMSARRTATRMGSALARIAMPEPEHVLAALALGGDGRGGKATAPQCWSRRCALRDDREERGEVMNDGVRRKLLLAGGAVGALLMLRDHRVALAKDDEAEEEVSPAEDLMREHGVLKRALLVYGEASARLRKGAELPADVVPGTAALLREFIEQYHERLEEEHLFPRFRSAGIQVELVEVLQRQHQAGHAVTDRILEMSRGPMPGEEKARLALAAELDAYVRMYAPHEAREDTVLFPAFRKIVSEKEYAELGEKFETREDELFGEGGFEKKVAAVAALEQKLGIYDLAQFTPRS